MTTIPAGDVPPARTTGSASAAAWREVLPLFLGSRLLIWAVAGLSLTVVAKGPYFAAPAGLADWFLRWDAGYYLDIATHGYHWDPAHSTDVVFFPLYPMLVYAASLGGWVSPQLAGYAVSFTCLWVACVWLWKAVAREWQDARLATLAVAFLLFGPVSFFFSCIYAEPLFLLLAIGSIDSARRGRWWRAGVLGALAALTRLVGVALVLPLLWQLFESVRRAAPRPRFPAAALAACLLPIAGLLAYGALMWVRFGDPLLYLHAQDRFWGRHFAWFYLLLERESFSNVPFFYQLWFLSALLGTFALLLFGGWLRIPVTYSIYALSAVFICISSRFVEGLPRYFSVIFPLYVVAALIANRWPRLAYPLLAVSSGLLVLSVILFVNGYWFT